MTTSFAAAVRRVADGQDALVGAASLYEQLSDAERLWLLDGDVECWLGLLALLTSGYNHVPIVAGEVARLGIPGLRFSDGPRGVVMGASTAFPVAMARGATWDVELEERVGRAMGVEARAQGANLLGSVCINLPRHPGWGRAQETYGEDPVLLGEMGAAAVRGLQDNVMACVKHFALNSIENTRQRVDVTADEADLHEVYLPHFRRVVEQGVDVVMSAYNSVNGEWCGQNPQLLNGVLREQWGFPGVTITDFVVGLRDAAASLRAGLDVEMPYRQQRAQHLPNDLAAGRARWEDVERAGVRILAAQLRLVARLSDEVPDADVVAGAEHCALAREVAVRSMVLLRNEPVDGSPLLPLDAAGVSSIALLGRLANLPATGDAGSSAVRAPRVATALEGLRAALPDADVRHYAGDDAAAAAAVAAGCDVAVVLAGYTAHDEGEYFDEAGVDRELVARHFPPFPDGLDLATLQAAVRGMIRDGAAGGDRADLALRGADEELILAVGAANPRTVVAVVASGAVLVQRWHRQVPAVVLTWYAGMEGGHALADVLLGHPDAGSGRLPFAMPASAAHLPAFPPSPRRIRYERLHGQRLLDHLGVRAEYPLGHGLSYTTFTVTDLQVERVDDEACVVRVLVHNAGSRTGRHPVQIYGQTTTGDRAGRRALVGFGTAAVPPGQTRAVTVDVSLRPLARWQPEQGQLVVPASDVLLEVADDAGAVAILSALLPVPEGAGVTAGRGTC